MRIEFYNVADDPRVIQKNLGTLIYACPNVNILGSCSIKDPVFVLSYDSNLIAANYFKVVEWNRYYFMGEPVFSPGGRCSISGHEDVLMSNADAILSLHAYCSRCESRFERYAVDNSVLSLVTTNVTTIPSDLGVFSADGSVRQYLLTVKGGRYSGNS